MAVTSQTWSSTGLRAPPFAKDPELPASGSASARTFGAYGTDYPAKDLPRALSRGWQPQNVSTAGVIDCSQTCAPGSPFTNGSSLSSLPERIRGIRCWAATGDMAAVDEGKDGADNAPASSSTTPHAWSGRMLEQTSYRAGADLTDRGLSSGLKEEIVDAFRDTLREHLSGSVDRVNTRIKEEFRQLRFDLVAEKEQRGGFAKHAELEVVQVLSEIRARQADLAVVVERSLQARCTAAVPADVHTGDTDSQQLLSGLVHELREQRMCFDSSKIITDVQVVKDLCSQSASVDIPSALQDIRQSNLEAQAKYDELLSEYRRVARESWATMTSLQTNPPSVTCPGLPELQKAVGEVNATLEHVLAEISRFQGQHDHVVSTVLCEVQDGRREASTAATQLLSEVRGLGELCAAWSSNVHCPISADEFQASLAEKQAAKLDATFAQLLSELRSLGDMCVSSSATSRSALAAELQEFRAEAQATHTQLLAELRRLREGPGLFSEASPDMRIALAPLFAGGCARALSAPADAPPLAAEPRRFVRSTDVGPASREPLPEGVGPRVGIARGYNPDAHGPSQPSPRASLDASLDASFSEAEISEVTTMSPKPVTLEELRAGIGAPDVGFSDLGSHGATGASFCSIASDGSQDSKDMHALVSAEIAGIVGGLKMEAEGMRQASR